jgi:hypothetical protein
MPGRILSKENESKLRSALDALRAVLGLLEDDPEPEPESSPEPEPVAEAALEAEFVPLVERATRRDGTIPVKIIEPGWGSSGYYPADVLERDGPAVFRRGVQMFWDHPTQTEEAERPEGSLDKLAAELVSDARYDSDGIAGPGLYADAKVFGPYREAVDELAPHIGVSIRALGRAVPGEAEGRKGQIVQQITAAKTVDFVTQAGAGGKIIEMFEAARRPAPDESQAEIVEEVIEVDSEMQETVQRLEQENARLRETLLLHEAREFVQREVAGANVPDVAKARLVEQLAVNPPIAEDGQLDGDAYRARIVEAVEAEQAYLASALPTGRVEGMGAAQQSEPVGETAAKRMAEAFSRLGLSESSVEHAVNGRRF